MSDHYRSNPAALATSQEPTVANHGDANGVDLEFATCVRPAKREGIGSHGERRSEAGLEINGAQGSGAAETGTRFDVGGD